jgi:hypothetical protein
MAAIVAPGICRYTVNGTYAGQPVANIIDMQIDTTGSVEDRATAVDSQAGIIINEWSDHILPIVSAAYVATSVSWVDLDSLTATTGERTSTDQEDWPLVGGLVGAPTPGNVAVRVGKRITPSRGQRQGRMYLVGQPEANTDATNPNVLTSAVITTINGQLESFLGNINQSVGGALSYTSAMVVVHTVDDVYQDYSVVQALTVEARLGSQRRRLDL